MQITEVMRMGARLLIERYLSWCPRAKTFATGDLSEHRCVSENVTGGRDAGTWGVTRPALVFLLPLLMALAFIAYTIAISIVHPSVEVQMAVKFLLFGIPIAILILYGRSTHDTTGAMLVGALLFPLFEIYSQFLGFLLDPGFILTPLIHWPMLFVTTGPFILLLGAAGFFASGKTIRSLVIATVLGILAVAIMLGVR